MDFPLHLYNVRLSLSLSLSLWTQKGKTLCNKKVLTLPSGLEVSRGPFCLSVSLTHIHTQTEKLLE